jgi:beta-galactosidase
VNEKGYQMRFPAAFILGAAVGFFCCSEAGKLVGIETSDRHDIDFNAGWLFLGKDIPAGHAISLNETAFRPVCLPHTCQVVPHTEIDTSSFAMISWYRKHFTPSEKYRGKRFRIKFQAVSKAAEVFCNGKLIGEHKGAYTPFGFDITEHVTVGKKNVIAVRVDSRQRKDIPPEGIKVDYMIFGGIVRDVTLEITNRLSVVDVYVKQDSGKPAYASVTGEIVNNDAVERKGTVTLFIVDSLMKVAGSSEDTFTIASDSVYTFSARVGPLTPLIQWHPDNPFLYTLYTRISCEGTVIDEYRKRFGMRSVRFDKKDGRCYINNRPVKLRGLNRHETYPFIGRAAANRLQRRDADILKYDFGCNTVRCSHYPQDPEFLDRCDEIGLMVLEEIPGWNFVHTKKEWQSLVLKNVEEMVLRDRTHPSVISFGIRVNQSADFRKLYSETNRVARTLDPGRPTHGVRVLGRGTPDQFFEDIWAQNFLIPDKKPKVMPWITTESVGHKLPVHSWDSSERLLKHMLAHAAVHDSAAANQAMAGLLGWCAFDYHSPYQYSEKSVTYHGVADMFRFPKHAAYFYRSQADPDLYGSMVYIAHYWDRGLEPNDVWVVSNCDSVGLFVEGVSQGIKRPFEYMHLPHPLFVWRSVPFIKGTVKAVGYLHGVPAAEMVRITPGPPLALMVSADDTELETGGDMTRIEVKAVDSNNQLVPRTGSMVKLKVTGAAHFLGENPAKLEDGKTAFYIQSRTGKAGTVICSARAKGLKKGTVNVKVHKGLKLDAAR